MPDFLRNLFATDFMPHGHCYYWQPEIVWLHVVSDGATTLAYYSIPVALLLFAARRKDLGYRWMVNLFGLFILACGTTHLLSIYTLWEPVYRFEGIVKAITGVVSVATAALLWPLIPKALAVPSPAQLAQANRELEESNRRILEAERLKDELFANVSHELRTPLSLILAPVETLRGGAEVTSERRTELLDTVHNNALRLLQMVNGLLDFSRIEAGRVQIERKSVDVEALTRSILDDFRPTTHNEGLELSFEHDLEATTVRIDPHAYERIVFNLLSNAVKFTQSGGRVEVRLSSEGSTLRLRVRDTGIGIEEADQATMFEKFRQAEGSSTRRFEGTGLGLALVREFAELLGGEVTVASEPGVGSTFEVTIHAPPAEGPGDEEPARALSRLLPSPPTPQPAARASEAERAGEVQPAADRPRVIVAEDNAELASYIAELLGEIADVEIVEDGARAFERVHAEPPDLLLADVMMPERDGVTLCRDLKGDPATAPVPVVLLTALTHRDALLRGWQAGADDYLFKPFHPQELVTRVSSLLSLVRERRQAEALRIRQGALERSNRELEQYASVVSHDLQEPLRKVHMFGDRLQRKLGEGADPELKRYVERMMSATTRMQRLIDDLLAYSRVTTKARPFAPVDLGSVMREVLTDLELTIEDLGAQVDVGELPTIEADAVQMEQLFRNLLGNALKFHREGVAPHVRVDAVQGPGRDDTPSRGRRCRIRVQDDGIGFDPAHASAIFEVFHRLHGVSEYEGTGMGLALCRRIVERHGGWIEAEGRPGGGATFTVTLPLHQASAPGADVTAG